MKTLTEKAHKLQEFLRKGIWQLRIEELSNAKARFVKFAKIALITTKTYARQKIEPQAVSLSYFSVMALVPLIALIFAIAGGIGLDHEIRTFLYENLGSADNQRYLDTLLASAQNIIDTAKSGWIGMLSALTYIWTIIRLMSGVENAFNNVWVVDQTRNVLKRSMYYFIILLLSPFVIMVLFATSFMYLNLWEYIGFDVASFTFIMKLISWALFYVGATFIFSAMYKFIPNHHVKYGMAFRAAIFAALVFTVVQFMYLETQVFVTGLNKVYGTLAAIPLFMIWLNVSWKIILMGSELSYAFQHVDNYNLEDQHGKDFAIHTGRL